ncbi:hypothetical protein HPB49_011912 [Dermacentor silvarum]|uniref:Uncharacterized protein n=1 Tax=Dermacentor silvarum TaxID=543639 RepID=A0ACB8CF34_DERSI|nr:hypothetical protein HPB49_011912 [Dermacentor silvarum]
MVPEKTALKHVYWKNPNSAPSLPVVGDSQTKHIYQYFDPAVNETPAIVSQCGALISDVPALLDFVPQNTTTIVLHVGTIDLARVSARKAFDSYCEVISHIAKERPEVTRISATLILPRTRNRRRGYPSATFVRCFNQEACYFNTLLKKFCRRSRLVFFLDHGFEWLPPHRVLAADGLHPNFEGVSLMACHIRYLCYKPSGATYHSWLDSAPSNPPPKCTKEPCVEGPSSDPALVMGQTTNGSPSQKESSPHNRKTRGHRKKAASKNRPKNTAAIASSAEQSPSAQNATSSSPKGPRYELRRAHTKAVDDAPEN